MCVIIAKNRGIELPSEDMLRNCFNNNPDGAGIMLACKDSVFGFKGLMTFDALKKKLEAIESRFGSLKLLPMVLHFRIGTHGSNVPENTHPFPISTVKDYDRLKQLEWRDEQGFAHNGIIHGIDHLTDVKKENVSDTMVFGRYYVSPIAKYVKVAKDQKIVNIIGDMADSKLCFLDASGKIATYGQFVSESGCSFSNDSFNKRAYKSYGSYSDYYSDFDWEEWYAKKAKAKVSDISTAGSIRTTAKSIDELKEDDARSKGLIHFDGYFQLYKNGEPSKMYFTPADMFDESNGMVYEWSDKWKRYVYLSMVGPRDALMPFKCIESEKE